MIVHIIKLHLRLPGCHSLKEKRMILQQIKAKISRQYNISISEVGDQDKWQKAELGAAQVSLSHDQGERTLGTLFEIIEKIGAAEILHYSLDAVED